MLPVSVVLPFCLKDRDDALRLLQWIAELGKVDTLCVLMGSADCHPEQMLPTALRAFSKVEIALDAENVDSHWKGAFNDPSRTAFGPNSIFRQAAWYMRYHATAQAWLFLEPDAIPLRPDWMEQISAAYMLCGKPFMGALVNDQTHPGSVGLLPHMSGVAVYPKNTTSLAGKAVMPGPIAFDVAGADAIMPQASFTKLIQHLFRAPSFTTMQQVEARIDAEAVIYHANKDGSLIPFLRQKLKGHASDCAVHNEPAYPAGPCDCAPTSAKPAGAPTCDIFIKTCPKDYEWLNYCLRSIDKYASGFRKVVLVMPNHGAGVVMPASLQKPGSYELKVVTDSEPGYLWQQAVKLEADKYTDADFILYMDSDCLFTRTVTPQDFLIDGKARWEFSSNMRDDQRVWVPVMHKFLGRKPQAEFMQRHPFMVPSWALPEIRQFCRYRHGVEMSDYIMAQADAKNALALTFSEWNCLGFFLHEFHHERIAWVEENSPQWKPDCVKQFWSHGGLSFEHSREMEDILGCGGNAVQGEPARAVASYAVETPAAPSPFDAIEILLQEASKSNIAKARVLKALKSAGLVKGGKLRTPATKTIPAPIVRNHDPILMCVQTYPGANAGLKRHLPFLKASGAHRLVAITTIDGKCEVPEGMEEVQIGDNKYIDGPHLPQRYIDILKWCLTQPENHFAIVEWDVLFFKPIKPWSGVCVVPAGGKLPNAKASTFFHCPHLIDRESAERLIPEMQEIIRQGLCKYQWPEASPDVFLSLAIDRTGITPRTNHFTHWTRNSWDIPKDEELAWEAVRNGVDCIHGCKTEHNLAGVVEALK